jgi:hypothetical protein
MGLRFWKSSWVVDWNLEKSCISPWDWGAFQFYCSIKTLRIYSRDFSGNVKRLIQLTTNKRIHQLRVNSEVNKAAIQTTQVGTDFSR